MASAKKRMMLNEYKPSQKEKEEKICTTKTDH
jgi:hypothetical protein